MQKRKKNEYMIEKNINRAGQEPFISLHVKSLNDIQQYFQ